MNTPKPRFFRLPFFACAALLGFAQLIPSGVALAGPAESPSDPRAAGRDAASTQPGQGAPLNDRAPSAGTPTVDPQDGVQPGADALAKDVLRANPALRSLEAQVESLEQATHAAGVWSDPVFATEYSNMALARPYPGGHAMSGVQLRLQQTFPAPGKIAAREAAAKAKVKVAFASVEERRNTLVGLVRSAFTRLALVRQLRRVTVDHIKLVQQLADVVQVRSEVGRANQVDIQRLLLLRDKLQDSLEDFDRDDQKLVSGLNATLHRPVTTPIDTPSEFGRPGTPTRAALITQSEQTHPTLLRLEALTRAETLDAAVAAKEGRPDVTAWAGYRFRGQVSGGDPGEDFFSVGASIPLPWFWNDRRWGSKKRLHEAKSRAATEAWVAERDRLRGRLDQQLAELQRAVSKRRRYTQALVPAAHATLDATFAVYPTGKASFESVYQAELQLLDFERTRRVAGAQSWLARYAIATDSAENLQLIPETPSPQADPSVETH